MKHTLAALLSLLLLAGLSGCGYSSSAVFQDDVKTVYVDMFESRTFRRDLEFMLTEAVKKRIATDTPYRVAAKEKADTILRGEVLEARQTAYAPDFRTRQPREKQLTLVVRVQWKDVRNGKMLVDRPLLLQSVDYTPAAGETEPFARQKDVDRLAARIVAQMYNEW